MILKLMILVFVQIEANKNVLLFIVDDLRPNLGCYGYSNAHTPNIDALAEKSFIFDNAFAQQALCGPSRNSFLTSRRPDTTKLYDFYSYWRNFSGNFTTMPQYFKENGYVTKSIGKVFHPGISSNFTDDERYSWTEKPFHPQTEKYKDAKVCYSEKSPFVPQKNIVCPVKPGIQPGKTLPDLEITQEAIKTLVNFQKKTFNYFLAIGFHKPHIPLKYPKNYKKYHPLKKIKLPQKRKKPIKLPEVAWNPWTDLRERDDIKYLNVSFPFGCISDKYAKRIIQSYNAAITYIDHNIGKILKFVDNNTIVVLIGDHGWSLGEHGEWSKYSNYEVALKIPFIIKIPEIKIKTRISQVVELVDVFPTLAELSGLKKIPKCPTCSRDILACTQGKSLGPILFNNEINDHFALSQYPRPGIFPTLEPNSDKPRLKNIKIMGYSIRTDRFRYTEWVKFYNFKPIWEEKIASELYDHYVDPIENNNIINNSIYKQIIVDIQEKLHAENKKYILC